jgi:hypothetical protein
VCVCVCVCVCVFVCECVYIPATNGRPLKHKQQMTDHHLSSESLPQAVPGHTHCHIIIHSVTSSYTVSHHHTQCHIIIHSVTSSYTVSHHHTQCHIIIHSVTSSYTVPHHHTQCHIIANDRSPSIFRVSTSGSPWSYTNSEKSAKETNDISKTLP